RKFTNCSGTSKSWSLTAFITTWRSSLDLPVILTWSPWTWLWTLNLSPFTNFTSSRAFSSEIPTFRLIDCLEALLAAGWIGPKCSAFSETWRRTAFSFSTSTAALSRSSVEERTSISWSSWPMLVPVSLKSNRCAISRRAWSTAFATSGIETSETMSNEKSCLAMRAILPWRCRMSVAILPRTGGCPSGQRERSVKSPAKPTEVRILLLPPQGVLGTEAHDISEPKPSELDEVHAGERMVDLLHRASCRQAAEVDRGEPRVLEYRDDIRLSR